MMNGADVHINVNMMLVQNISNHVAWYGAAAIAVVLLQTSFKPKGLLRANTHEKYLQTNY